MRQDETNLATTHQCDYTLHHPTRRY